MTLPLGQLFFLSKMTFQPPWLLKKNFFRLDLPFKIHLSCFPENQIRRPSQNSLIWATSHLFQVPKYPVHTCQSILCTEGYFTGLALMCVFLSLSPLCPRLSECWFHFSFLIFFIPVCLVAQSCSALCDPMDCSPPGSSVHGNSPGKNTREGCHALLQGIFPTQGSNPGLLHCRQFLYRLSTYLAHGKG